MEAPPPYTVISVPETVPETVPEPVIRRLSVINEPPPPKYYALPPTFSIGRKHTSHLVKMAEIKGHLALLHAFTRLRSQIRKLRWLPSGSGNAIDHMPFDQDARWVWYVSLAVERFTVWCESLRSADSSRPAAEFLPPLDVLMVWHAYLLNPGLVSLANVAFNLSNHALASWYAEDCIRLPIMRNLSKLTQIFSASLGSDLQALMAAEPSEARRSFWTTKTGRAFDALEDALGHQTKVFPCPKCQKPVNTAYMAADGTGYLQHDFQVYCADPACRMQKANGSKMFIDRNLLRARKFVDDLFRDSKELQAYFPGTLRTPYYETDIDKGKYIKNLIHECVVLQHIGKRTAEVTNKEWALFVLQKTLYNFTELRTSVLAHASDSDKPMVERVFSAYGDHRPFSVDLVGAVIRQGTFVKKMEDLEWTNLNYFSRREDEVALQHAIARYHAFLDLVSANPRAFNIPTLDIDLAWHTHQLMGSKYNSDCKQCVGRYVDHDDKVGEGKLASSFDDTCTAWKERFGLPYIYCGCPVPGKTMGRRLSNLLNSSPTTSRVRAPSYLIPLDRSDLLSSTHPSDHNSVIFTGTLESRKQIYDDQERRREKLNKLRIQESKSGSKKSDSKKDVPRKASDTLFGTAFLLPIPYHSSVSCVANGGHVESDPNTAGIAACAPTPVAYVTP
ncbi:hypothetical protein DXG01_002027 [Tephrocybe rancida]|nr:hypothetical protein DXG01_002027 [Tephrocybe rancida]